MEDKIFVGKPNNYISVIKTKFEYLIWAVTLLFFLIWTSL